LGRTFAPLFCCFLTCAALRRARLLPGASFSTNPSANTAQNHTTNIIHFAQLRLLSASKRRKFRKPKDIAGMRPYIGAH
jgi:hypothetical protein